MQRRRTPFLRGYQLRTFRNLLDSVLHLRGETLTVLFPRQAGKNEVSAALVAALLRMHAASGGSVVVAAPTLRPQGLISLERTFTTLRATDHLVAPAGRVRRAGNALVVGRAFAVFLSGSPAANVAGHTASLALICDEAQDVDADWFDRQFRPMAASTGASTVMLGTPWDGATLLDRAVARNRRRGRHHHEVGWRAVARAMPSYGEYVRAERDRLGRAHPLFRTQYGLETIDAAGAMLAPAAVAGLAGGHERLRSPRAFERYAAGLDFAGQGGDATALVIGRIEVDAVEVVELVLLEGLPFAEQLEHLAACLVAWRPAALVADASGLGGPLIAALEPRIPATRIEPVVFTAGVKTALGFELLAAAQTGALRLFADDGSAHAARMVAELRALRAEPAPGAQLRWGNDSGHDDIPVALALCLRAARLAGPERVARGRSG